MLLLVSLSCLALYNAQCTCKTHKHGEVSQYNIQSEWVKVTKYNEALSKVIKSYANG